MDEAERWRQKAEEDLEAATFLHEHDKLSYAAFLYQQAVEKGLKAVLVEQGGGLVQTHDCFILAQQAEAPHDIRHSADILSPYYFRTRYPDAVLVDMDDDELSDLQEAAREVFTWIRKQF